MLYNYFIDRPIFANVIALVTVLLGATAVLLLPVQQFPDITPPTVRVNARYPGAGANVVANTVAGPLEEEINGVEHMLYMNSTSSGDGTYTLEVTFDIGTDLNEVQTQVQNRISRAEPQLPQPVRRQGVTARKQSTNLTLIVSLVSEDPDIDSLFLANFARLRIRDELSRIEGVGQVTVFGGNTYAMRIWLNPEKLEARRLSVQDVLAAVRNQNSQVAAGQIGRAPAPDGQQFQYTVTTTGRLSDVDEFEEIVVKTTDDGRNLRLKDVGRVELGSRSYAQFTEKEGRPNANIGIYQLPGANALEVSEKVKQRIETLSESFPAGIRYSIPLDTTQFVSASINEVYKTLIEAGVLVLVVIVVFLQDWRAVLVPATTVPVTIVGAFAAMYLLGFSVNTLTMFGLVLSIGIVVDDAIVVVENAAHHVERGLESREAAKLAMRQVFSPVVATSLVLIAVFLPASFLGGITGEFYRQFALTIAATAVLSTVNAVTLKPAQCALYLRPPPEKRNVLARGFNHVYSRVEHAYARSVGAILRGKSMAMLVFVLLIGGAAWWYTRLPTGLLPTADHGQRAMGTAVVGGMIASTLLAILFVPVFYALCQNLDGWSRRNRT